MAAVYGDEDVGAEVTDEERMRLVREALARYNRASSNDVYGLHLRGLELASDIRVALSEGLGGAQT